jgi:hypothetical protein
VCCLTVITGHVVSAYDNLDDTYLIQDLMNHLFFFCTGYFCDLNTISYAKCNCLTSVQTRQYVGTTFFAGTRSNVDRDKMILSRVCQPKSIVLCERNKCSPPCNRLYTTLSTRRCAVSFRGSTHIRDGNGRRNGIVELPNKWVGGLGSEARRISQIVDGQATGENQDAFLPGMARRIVTTQLSRY